VYVSRWMEWTRNMHARVYVYMYRCMSRGDDYGTTGTDARDVGDGGR